MALVGDSYEYYDKKFYEMTVPIAEVEELFSECRWAEGPVWFADGDYLVWSDIPNNRLLRWVPDQRRERLLAPIRTSPTATPATGRAGWSPASMAAGGSAAPSPTAPSSPSPSATTASA